jgi:hypothetical protein
MSNNKKEFKKLTKKLSKKMFKYLCYHERKKGTSWQELSIEDLFNGAIFATGKLITRYHEDSLESVQMQCVDIANWLAMLIDSIDQFKSESEDVE